MKTKTPRSRLARGLVACGGLALAIWGPWGCGSSDEVEAGKHYVLDDEGQARLDYEDGDVKRWLAEPRRYPFKVAVAPLYIDWRDGGRDEDGDPNVLEKIEEPIKGNDPSAQRKATAWPSEGEALARLDPTLRAKEEEEIKQAAKTSQARKNAGVAAPGSQTPPGKGPVGSTGAPRTNGDRAALLREWAERHGAASPPPPEEKKGADGTAPVGTATPAKKKKGLSEAEEEALAREIANLDGKQFAIDENGFQARMVNLLEQFGMFEAVEKVQFVTQKQRNDPLELLAQADAAGCDFLLVGRLRQNKVSYNGISGIGSFLGDFFLWLTLYWPSEFWPGVESEEYRSDLELEVAIYDVRSKEELWRTPYRGLELVTMTQFQRGWIPWGIILVRLGLRTDTMMQTSGLKARPLSWLEVEYQVLRDLWSPVGFKGELDKKQPTFEDRVNGSAVDARRQALVVGISRYGPAANGVLGKLARQAGADRTKMRALYEDDQVDVADRVYAESDVLKLTDVLADKAGFGRGEIQTLTGAQASRVQLKAAIRRICKARRPDPALVYLCGQVVVADDPSGQGDLLKKYFLPWDADLETLETLRESTAPDRAQKVLDHLDRTAISFQWLAETLNKASLEDHRYIMSREVLLILDCAVPGDLTGLRYAPDHAANLRSGWKPKQFQQGGGGKVDKEKDPLRQPSSEAPPPSSEAPPPPSSEAPVPPPPPGTEAAPPEQPPVRRRPRRIGWLWKVEPSTLPAQQGGPQPGQGQGAPAGKASEPQITEHFIQELIRPGRKIVLTGRFNDRLLDVIPQKRGAFMYHFIKGLEDRARVPGREVTEGDKVWLIVEGKPVIDYARARIEDESRTLNAPQSVLTWGDNDDFPVLRQAKR